MSPPRCAQESHGPQPWESEISVSKFSDDHLGLGFKGASCCVYLAITWASWGDLLPQACEGVWDATTPTSTPATVTVTPTAVLVLLGSYFCTIVSLHF